MSTYIYLTCECHTPRLLAEDESGQHLYDLPRIRQEIADRDPLVRLFHEGDTEFDYFTRNSLRFLSRHQECVIGIEDEYGERHPTHHTHQRPPGRRDNGGSMSITTTELDTLPEGSIVLTHPPMCFIKIGEDTRRFGGDWRTPYKVPGAPGEFRDVEYVARVATRVLYDPSTEATR